MVSISLEHEDYIDGNEVNGEFIIYGEYKASNDTTEILSFKEQIPFNLLIPDNLIRDTVNVDVDDFTYEVLNNNTIKVCIDLYLIGEEIVIRDKDDVRDLEEIYDINEDVELDNKIKDEDIVDFDIEDINMGKGNINIDNFNNLEVNNTVNINNEVNEVGEYIIYHIHIVKEGETIEHIVNQYDTNIEIVKEYNDVSKINVGDKLIIPEIYYGTD
jgi:LysM repeat protein